jgi:hypothetical protein
MGLLILRFAFVLAVTTFFWRGFQKAVTSIEITKSQNPAISNIKST